MKKRPPYKITKSKTLYENPFLSLSSDNILFDDDKEFEFIKVDMTSGSSVIAVNDKDEVYLVEEYKHAIGDYSLEIISGRIDDNETPLNAAKRELKEEAGLLAKEWVDLGFINPFTSVIKSPNHLFLATDLEETDSKPDESETLRVIKIPFKKAVDMVRSGEINHAGSCIAILKAEKYLNNT